jgi:flagellar export protein FliJ
MTRQALVQRQRLDLLDELRKLAATGTVDVDRTISRRYYAARLAGEIHALNRTRSLVARQLEHCRLTLAHAEREVQVLEKLEDKHRAAFEYEQNRREARELDETWVAAHIGELSQ